MLRMHISADDGDLGTPNKSLRICNNRPAKVKFHFSFACGFSQGYQKVMLQHCKMAFSHGISVWSMRGGKENMYELRFTDDGLDHSQSIIGN